MFLHQTYFFRRVLKVISMPRRRKSDLENHDLKDTEWEEAVEAILRDITGSQNPQDSHPESGAKSRKSIVQIIFYESSV
jgi:hypothetical protein